MKFADKTMDWKPQMKKQYYGIDLVKFIMAFFVVAIHIEPFRSVSENMNFGALICTRVAVPFFFCASGFFLRRKLDMADSIQNYNKTGMSYVKRLLWLYFVWTIIYIPGIVIWINNDNPGIIRIVQQCIFSGSYLPLWYLPALAIATLFILQMYKKIKIKYIVVISGILYLVGLFDLCWRNIIKNTLFDTMLHQYDLIFITTRNGIFFGLFFVSLGFISHEINFKIKTYIYGMIISFILLCAEMLLYREYQLAGSYEGTLMSAVLSFFTFNFAKELNLKESNVYIKLRSAGALIYFLHCWGYLTYFALCTYVLKKTFNSIVGFGYTLIFSLILAFGILWLQNKKCFQWLKKIY